MNLWPELSKTNQVETFKERRITIQQSQLAPELHPT